MTESSLIQRRSPCMLNSVMLLSSTLPLTLLLTATTAAAAAAAAALDNANDQCDVTDTALSYPMRDVIRRRIRLRRQISLFVRRPENIYRPADVVRRSYILCVWFLSFLFYFSKPDLLARCWSYRPPQKLYQMLIPRLNLIFRQLTDSSSKFYRGSKIYNFHAIFDRTPLCIAIVSNCSDLSKISNKFIKQPWWSTCVQC